MSYYSPTISLSPQAEALCKVAAGAVQQTEDGTERKCNKNLLKNLNKLNYCLIDRFKNRMNDSLNNCLNNRSRQLKGDNEILYGTENLYFIYP